MNALHQMIPMFSRLQFVLMLTSLVAAMLFADPQVSLPTGSPFDALWHGPCRGHEFSLAVRSTLECGGSTPPFAGPRRFVARVSPPAMNCSAQYAGGDTRATNPTFDSVDLIPFDVRLIIFPLLCSDRVESRVLETSYGRLEDLKVDDGGALVVVALGFVGVGTVDVEVGDAAAVYALYFDAGQVAAAGEREGAQEDVVGADHARLPR